MEYATYVVLSLGLVAWRLSSVTEKPPVYTGDKRIWAAIAEAPLFSREFLLARRPMLYPLLFKTGLSDADVVLVQALISGFAWTLLAYAIAKFVWRPARIPVFALSLLAALVTPVRAWDLVIRAESTSNSAIAFTIAAVLLFLDSLRKAGVQHIVWAALTCFFASSMALARDSNPYILLLFVPAVIFAAYIIRSVWYVGYSRRVASVLVVASWFTLSAIAAQWTARAAPRYDFPLMNVIFKRILPDPEKRAFFVTELGMPISRQLLTRSGKFASSNGRYAYVQPQLEPFREWLFTRGYESYQRYLITHLRQTIAEANAGFSAVVGYNPAREGRSTQTPLTEFADAMFVDGALKRCPLVACTALLLLGIVGSIHNSWANRVLGGVVICLVWTALTQLYICYHADAMEVMRHSIAVGIALRLGVVAGIALLVNVLASLWPILRRGWCVLFVRLGNWRRLAVERARGS